MPTGGPAFDLAVNTNRHVTRGITIKALATANRDYPRSTAVVPGPPLSLPLLTHGADVPR